MSFFKKKIQSILRKYPFSRIDFIIAGTQKGGTTALYEYFRLHQNICMADKKELHFFDEDRYFEKKNPNYSKYHKYFNPNEHSQVIGEATPIYMYWNKSIERIYVYNPQIKLIIILFTAVFIKLVIPTLSMENYIIQQRIRIMMK